MRKLASIVGICFLIIFAILMILFVFDYKVLGTDIVYVDYFIPPKTYYVHKGQIMKLNYVKVYHSCSYNECNGYYDFIVNMKNYSKDSSLKRVK